MNDDPPISASPTPATPESGSSSTPTATGNQNLIVGLILGAVVLLLFLLILQMTSDGFGGDDPEIAALRQELQDRKNSMGSGNTPGIIGQSPQDLASRLSADSARLATLVTQLQAMLNKVQGDLKMSQTTVQTLSSQLTTRTSNAADNAALNQQLKAALSRSSAAENQLQSLRQQFAGAPTTAQMEAILKERDTLRSQVVQLNAELRKGESDAPGKEADPQPEKSGQ